MVPRDILRSAARAMEDARAFIGDHVLASAWLGTAACLVMATLLVLAWGPAFAVIDGGTVGASHYDEGSYTTGGENNATIFTYGDRPMNEQRMPGEAGQSYWNQNIINFIEQDGERAYLNRTMVWRPVVSACEVPDLDNLGVDRGSTYQDERETDEEKIDSLEDSRTDYDVRDRWESEWEGAGDDHGHWDLAGPDTEWDYVELVVVDWRVPSESPTGPYFGLENGDRAVAAQSGCFTNPEEPGWYRWAWTSDYEFEDGSMSESDDPSFSHWFWICDCEDEQEARETLGPPPSEREGGDDGGADDGSTDDGGTDDGSTDDGTGDDSADDGTGDDSADDGTGDDSADDGTGDDSADDGTGDDGADDTADDGGDDGTGDDGADDTADDGGDDGTGDDDTDDGESTPGDEQPGFGLIAALVALLAAALLAARRR